MMQIKLQLSFTLKPTIKFHIEANSLHNNGQDAPSFQPHKAHSQHLVDVDGGLFEKFQLDLQIRCGTSYSWMDLHMQ